MSAMCWQTQLRQTLERFRKADQPPRIAIVGVGHELRGDDAIGIKLAHALHEQMGTNEHILVVEAGSAPENCCGLLRRFKPEMVLVIDAAQMNEAPGSVRWLDWQDITDMAVSTHSTSLRFFADYLTSELDCHTALLGIQPASMAFDNPLTPILEQTLQEVSAFLAELLQKRNRSENASTKLTERLLTEVHIQGGAWEWMALHNDKEASSI